MVEAQGMNPQSFLLTITISKVHVVGPQKITTALVEVEVTDIPNRSTGYRVVAMAVAVTSMGDEATGVNTPTAEADLEAMACTTTKNDMVIAEADHTIQTCARAAAPCHHPRIGTGNRIPTEEALMAVEEWRLPMAERAPREAPVGAVEVEVA